MSPDNYRLSCQRKAGSVHRQKKHPIALHNCQEAAKRHPTIWMQSQSLHRIPSREKLRPNRTPPGRYSPRTPRVLCIFSFFRSSSELCSTHTSNNLPMWICLLSRLASLMTSHNPLGFFSSHTSWSRSLRHSLSTASWAPSTDPHIFLGMSLATRPYIMR